MKNKILSFIFDGEKFLLLRNNSKDPSHGGDYWFTVTGEIEKNETSEDAVKREVKEETNLFVEKIFPLNWGSVYLWKNEECKEMNFLSYVNNEEVLLNEEHSEYKWVDFESFIKEIHWLDSKTLLKNVLKKALVGEVFFNKKERGQ